MCRTSNGKPCPCCSHYFWHEGISMRSSQNHRIQWLQSIEGPPQLGLIAPQPLIMVLSSNLITYPTVVVVQPIYSPPSTILPPPQIMTKSQAATFYSIPTNGWSHITCIQKPLMCMEIQVIVMIVLGILDEFSDEPGSFILPYTHLFLLFYYFLYIDYPPPCTLPPWLLKWNKVRCILT